MNFSDLEKTALQLNDLYEQLETKRYGRVWTTQELALGFMGDVGDLAKLIQAHVGVRTILMTSTRNLVMNCQTVCGPFLSWQTSAELI
jgi:hypothetical protein